VDYYADIGVSIMFYMMLAVSLNLLLGFAGQISLAQGIFYGIGAYAAGLLMVQHDWSFAPAALAATIIAFVAASSISIPALRVVGEYLILLTLAFHQVIQQLMVSSISFTGGLDGLSGVPPLTLFGSELTTPTKVFGPMLGLTVIVVAFCWWIAESPFGRVLKGIREDEVAARSLGKATAVHKLVVFGVAAGVAGLAGAVSASYYQFIAPGSYSLDLSIFIVAIVILGGAGSILGSLVGAFGLGVLPAVLQNVGGLSADRTIVWQGVIYGLAIVAFMRFRPMGIVPEGALLATRARAVTRRVRRAPSALVPTRAFGVEAQEPGFAAGSRVSGSRGEPSSPAASERPGRELSVRPHLLSVQSPKRAGGEGEEIICVRELAKSFGGLKAVNGVELVLRRGQITALIGPNGAGKTTIFNLVTGVAKPDRGSVILGGEDITGKSLDRLVRRGLARSFQDVRIFRRLSVLENVAIGVPDQPGENLLMLFLRPLRTHRKERDTRARARAYLAFVGLEHKAAELVGNLSFAEQKLVALARLLATECEVLLLDEPTSGLDPVTVDKMIDLVLRLCDVGRTVLIVEHSLHVVERLADHIYFLEQGRVTAEGKMADLMSQPRLVEAYFGT
jgi:branched-chain amino acid transport system permease protein